MEYVERVCHASNEIPEAFARAVTAKVEGLSHVPSTTRGEDYTFPVRGKQKTAPEITMN